MFVDNLIKKVKECKNHTVVGLDPRIEYIPESITDSSFKNSESYAQGVADAFFRFNKGIIDSVYDIVPAVKPQIAFYEQYGLEGIKAFIKTCEYAKAKELIIVADAKRGDIGSTAEAYSEFYLGTKENSLDIDSLTINPYLGSDSIEPFVKDCTKNNKGIFILVKTSNKSSSDIQDLVCNGKKVYEYIADMVVKLGKDYSGEYGYAVTGAVVGATYSEDAKLLRKIMSKNYFLVPGYGAQGAGAKDVVDCFNEDGLGAIINSSRGIIAAYKLDRYKDKYDINKFAEAARQAAIDMRDEINAELTKCNKIAW